MYQKIFILGKVCFKFTMLVRVKSPNGKEQYLPCLSWNRNKEPYKTLGVFNAVTVEGFDPMVRFVVKVPNGKIRPSSSENGIKKFLTRQWLIVEVSHYKFRVRKAFIAGYKKEEDETVKFDVREENNSVYSNLTQKLDLSKFKEETQPENQEAETKETEPAEEIEPEIEIQKNPKNKKKKGKTSVDLMEKQKEIQRKRTRQKQAQEIELDSKTLDRLSSSQIHQLTH
jgi:flagellar biosynthesis GTPase FlhF